MGVSVFQYCPKGEKIMVWIDNFRICSRAKLCKLVCEYNIKGK